MYLVCAKRLFYVWKMVFGTSSFAIEGPLEVYVDRSVVISDSSKLFLEGGTMG